MHYYKVRLLLGRTDDLRSMAARVYVLWLTVTAVSACSAFLLRRTRLMDGVWARRILSSVFSLGIGE